MSFRAKDDLVEPAAGTVQIRQCRPEDFEGVLRLLVQLWSNESLDPNRIRPVFDRALESDRQIYLCATIRGQVVGFGSLTIKNNLWQQGYLANVDELVVEAEQRGRGIGKELLEHLVDLASQRGCRRIELDSSFHREQAHQFYEAQGFQKRAYLFSKLL
jgi:GNAT superfamily N-acetyltransferase